MLKFRRPIPRQAGETCVALGHLFSTVFAEQMPVAVCPKIRTSDGYASIWMPTIEFAITSMESSSPVAALERTRAAEMVEIDILTMDLSRHGDLVECQLDLYASRRTHKFAVDRLALWISPEKVAALVPYRARGGLDVLPPCFVLTSDGPQLTDDPFSDQVEWSEGIDRAIEAAKEAIAFQKQATATAAAR